MTDSSRRTEEEEKDEGRKRLLLLLLLLLLLCLLTIGMGDTSSGLRGWISSPTSSGTSATQQPTPLPERAPPVGAPPVVAAVTLDDPSPTAAAAVSWTVTFSEAVQGVDARDFRLVVSGLGGTPELVAVAPDAGTPSNDFTVTSSTGSGEGTLGLNVVDDDTVIDAAGTPLGGAGNGNGAFTGAVYAIDHVAPPKPVLTIVPSDPSADASPTFAFTDAADDVDHYECSIDAGPFFSCVSPETLTDLAPGDHEFVVRAVDTAGNRSPTATFRWVIELPETGLPYAITGRVSPNLYPGGPASPIAITFNSPNRGSGVNGTRVSRLTVSIASVTDGQPGPNPCTAADFALTQIGAAAYPFYVRFAKSSLASLIGADNLPKLRMLDRTDVVTGDGTGNQDACKGATVHLAFRGRP
jgi:hypothetical protein